MTDSQRPVLISMEFARELGIADKCEPVLDDITGRTGVVNLSVDELIALATATATVEWGEPDAHGRYEPTLTIHREPLP